ncbi:MAG TPA: nickel-dependent lactate racemase [Candidatus Polarisedimenticolia bacterium]|nr:nickel-dependent lactate racemase [Candidatus Polarisedimenticolia bacterium]
MTDGKRESPGRLALGYGSGRVDFTYDPGRFEVVDPIGSDPPELGDDELLAKLESPIGSPPLGEIVSPSHSVCIVVPDATRASGSDRVAALLLRRLANFGVPDGQIEFLVGAGTHRPPTPEEITRIVGYEPARRVAVRIHDAYDAVENAPVGVTSRGTPVEVDRRLLKADRVFVVGAIGFHYVAGFSGGRKGVLPGCGSDRSIQANHLLAFDRTSLSKAEGIESGRLEGNPVSEDMEEACGLVGPSFLVNTVLGGANRIVGLYAGNWRAAHRRGCAEYLQEHSVQVARRRNLVVVSCGGSPRDLNMIQSHKALEHARLVLKDGGDLVLLAECADGLGRPDFLDWFVPGGARATAQKLVSRYQVHGQTAWGIRWKSERYKVRLVSALDPATVRRMGMIPHASLAEALAASNPGPGYLIPHGLGTLPVLIEPLARRAAG